MTDDFSNLVSVDWLNEHLTDPNLVVLDATLKKMPNGELINPAAVYITGAREFNFDTEICQQETELPHMMPTAQAFEKAVRLLGIDHDSTVVVYDAMGLFSSARAWWMFKSMGHRRVFVLNGGLPKWQSSHYPLQDHHSKALTAGDFSAQFDPSMVYSAEQILQVVHSQPKDSQPVQMIDARSHGRFNGVEVEPRKGLRAGHIPGSYCLPFNELLDNGQMIEKPNLCNKLRAVVKHSSAKLVFSCGSGVTACILALAAAECGYRNCSVYDGSWSEWGAREELPIEANELTL